MSERPNWRDAQYAVTWPRNRPSDYRIILMLVRLPFADAKVLEWLSGVRATTVVYRSLTRLEQAGLISGLSAPTARGSAPQRFYLTDLRLAALALDQDLEVTELARRNHARGSDLLALLPRLPQLASLYDLLGAIAGARDGRPHLVAWERPWHWRYRHPTAKAPVSVTLPAFAALSWGNESRSYLLLPDLGTFPPGVYRTALDRLLQLRRVDSRAVPPLLIATDGAHGLAAWRELLDDIARGRFDVPLAAHALEWTELRAGLQHLERAEGSCRVSADHLIRPKTIQPLRVRQSTSPLPRLVANALEAPTGAPDGVGRLALSLTPADYRFLDMAACHPFLPSDSLAIVLGWHEEAVRRRRNRLIDRGLARVVEPEEIGGTANLQLMELSRRGLEMVAAYRGLSLAVAVREVGFAGGGPDEPIGTRTKLLWNLPHTLGADELFICLYRLVRRFAEAGGDDAVVEWQNATACSRRYLRPDGYGIYRRNGRHFGFFLEFDRGTMNRRDYFRKFSAYYDYATTRRFERDYHGYPTVLIVTTSNGAEERIVRVSRAAAVGRSVSLPLLLTCRWRVDDPTNPHGLLGRIWREPQAEIADRRYWLPASQSRSLRGERSQRLASGYTPR